MHNEGLFDRPAILGRALYRMGNIEAARRRGKARPGTSRLGAARRRVLRLSGWILRVRRWDNGRPRLPDQHGEHPAWPLVPCYRL